MIRDYDVPGAENRGWIEIRPDDRGKFDEIVACNVDFVHLEMMDDGLLWIRLDKGSDAQVVRVSAKKRKLRITTEADGGTQPEAKALEQG